MTIDYSRYASALMHANPKLQGVRISTTEQGTDFEVDDEETLQTEYYLSKPTGTWTQMDRDNIQSMVDTEHMNQTGQAPLTSYWVQVADDPVLGWETWAIIVVSAVGAIACVSIAACPAVIAIIAAAVGGIAAVGGFMNGWKAKQTANEWLSWNTANELRMDLENMAVSSGTCMMGDMACIDAYVQAALDHNDNISQSAGVQPSQLQTFITALLWGLGIAVAVGVGLFIFNQSRKR